MPELAKQLRQAIKDFGDEQQSWSKLQKLRKAIATPTGTWPSENHDDRIQSTPSPDIVIIDDEELEPNNTLLKKFKGRRERRLKRVEQSGETYLDCEILSTFVLPLGRKKLPLHLEIIVLDPPIDMVLRNKKSIAPPKKNKPDTVLLEEANLQECLEDVSNEAAPLSRERSLLNVDSREPDAIKHGKEVDLFVTVRLDPKTLKPGRFMTIRQLAVVKVFSLKPNVGLEEDLSTDPSFIPVKCIFEKGRPRCAYINLTEPIYDAKNRMRAQLKLTDTISKLIFDNEVISDGETPQSIGIEADDIIEVHFSL
ncbi:unnamed protein product [Angiostrongylus costaricensis]|uniref:Ubiquitin-like domain-containing protein n=1 Tax=Angiostrongylus costaricensis TaxID=334426 RepID=A0A0R3PM87_ANGCS|nr:unnamed protein product [Angiostrongylus costaricensis]